MHFYIMFGKQGTPSFMILILFLALRHRRHGTSTVGFRLNTKNDMPRQILICQGPYVKISIVLLTNSNMSLGMLKGVVPSTYLGYLQSNSLNIKVNTSTNMATSSSSFLKKVPLQLT